MTASYVGAAGMDHDHAYSQDLPYTPQSGPWEEHSAFHYQQQSPLYEHNGYAFPTSHAPLQTDIMEVIVVETAEHRLSDVTGGTSTL